MSQPTVHLEDELTTLIAESSTGMVDVRQDKKRWRFFFAEGELVDSVQPQE